MNRDDHKRYGYPVWWPVSAAQIQELVNSIESEVFAKAEKEVTTSVIGDIVMDKLKDVDEVAYVRFAFIYREFKDVNTFMDELKSLME